MLFPMFSRRSLMNIHASSNILYSASIRSHGKFDFSSLKLLSKGYVRSSRDFTLRTYCVPRTDYVPFRARIGYTNSIIYTIPYMHSFSRSFSQNIYRKQQNERGKNTALYLFATAISVFGLAYAAVPLYKVFCQATGYGGTTRVATADQIAKMTPVVDSRPLTINFTSSVSSSLPWSFTAQQKSVKVVPGETALAFYTASNSSPEPIIGVATYNVLPMKAGVYFNKVQCFCFDEQRLKGNEEVDMPVFFFVDPAFLDDPEMEDVQSITLSYTFFKSATAAP